MTKMAQVTRAVSELMAVEFSASTLSAPAVPDLMAVEFRVSTLSTLAQIAMIATSKERQAVVAKAVTEGWPKRRSAPMGMPNVNWMMERKQVV